MQSLYLRYRPQKIDELDLEEVRETLTKVAKSKSIPHALLFQGPKGTGKTSAARIIAKTVNCENPGKDGTSCGKCSQCKSIADGSNIDVIEMDAASNRGIDDIRSLRDAAKLVPNAAKKKVYIIDEAHMLTTEASNALLKIMEEPPEHVMFILATTNPEKLIPTIRSRATIVAFKKASIEEIVASLGKKLRQEKVKFAKESLELIAKNADGSFRDADKILEVALVQKVKVDDAKKVEKFIEANFPSAETLLAKIYAADVKGALEELAKLTDSGAQPEDIGRFLLGHARAELLTNVVEGEGSSLTKQNLILFIKHFGSAYASIKSSFLPVAPLEIAIIEWTNMVGGDSTYEEERKEKVSESKKVKAAPEEAQTTPEKEEKSTPEPSKAAQVVNSDSITDDLWKNILAAIRPKNASTEALLRAARPESLAEGVLTLGVYYKFHKEHLESNLHRMLLEEVLEQTLGQKVRVECVLTEPLEEIITDQVEDSGNIVSDPVLDTSSEESVVDMAEKVFGN